EPVLHRAGGAIRAPLGHREWPGARRPVRRGVPRAAPALRSTMPRVVITGPPLSQAHAPRRGRTPAERAAARQRAPRLRVLLAGADPAVRRAQGAALTSAGYRVVECDSARDTLRLCAAERPDLVLLDVEATTLGGLELLRRLRVGSAVPIIALGAAGDDATAV